MNILNPVIIAVISSVVAMTMGIILVTLSKSYPVSLPGAKHWGISCFMISLSVPLFMLRGFAPDFFSIILANFVIVASYTLMCLGSMLFFKVEPFKLSYVLLFLISYLLFFIYFTYVIPDVQFRVMTTGIFCSVMIFQQIKIYKQAEKSVGRDIILIALVVLFTGQIFRPISVLAGFKQPQSIYDISLPLLAYVIVPAIMIPMVTMGFVLLMSQENNRNLDYLSRHDSLTNCLNKKAFIEVFEKQIHHCNRYHNNLSLVMMDLDDFKRINDTLGHLVGDQVLMDFSQKVRSLLRDADYFGRFGGDEFFVLLPYTNQEQAELVVQRINHEGAKSNIAWSVSMGISEWHIGDSLDSLLSRSDQLLYENKDHKQNKE